MVPVRDTCGVRIDAGQDDGVILAIARRHQAASHLIALNKVLLLLAEMRFGDGRLTLQSKPHRQLCLTHQPPYLMLQEN